MLNSHHNLSETHILGPRTRHWIVRVSAADTRPWLQGAPICAALGRHQIAHAGVADTAVPYRVVRMNQAGTYFLACFDGEGCVLADGKWKRISAGTACLLLPHMLNAFHAVPGKRWRFCWVRYQQPPQQQPLVSASAPVVARFDAAPLRDAILGLHHECLGAGAPDTVHHWVELIQAYVLRFARPWQADNRLALLWEVVNSHLGEDWSLERLARQAHMSGEHLRRLCHRHLGRSPIHHVAFLRMRKAAELLASSDEKVEAIAGAVGYTNPFVFSNTFKKWTGWRPSEYPGRKRRA